jgi:class 3 adenylate cyclase/predicted ATPase
MFDEILDQAVAMLQRRGRAAYRTLQAQFQIDDGLLDVLKEELLYSQPQISDDGRGLVWTGAPAAPRAGDRRRGESEGRFQAALLAVTMMLQREKRVTYRTLQHIFSIDDMLMAEIRKELAFRQLAIEEDGEGLVWTGEMPPSVQPGEIAPNQQNMDATATTSPVSPAPQSHVLVTDTSVNGASSPVDAPVKPLSDEQHTAPQPVRSAPEAERRQLTVMFCDLADSTKLSQQLDPEDLREVIRAYQHTSAEAIARFDGYIAQHLGDGLLIYFGWPRAHEDDAQRALHAGLGIVEAITTTLNPRLKREHGVQLTIRLGAHTGPVVVGEMGGGDRLENLATGETVNIAARLEGVAQPNTVVVSSVTERLVRGAFALEDLGPQALKGVSEPMQVFRVLRPIEARREEGESMPDGGVFLVGRDEEIGLLLRRWEQSKEGLGQVVLISGEAGIGKSSLTATMRTRVAQEGYTRITFRCSPYHTNSALYPVITHLEQMLGFARDESSGTKLDKLEQVLRTTSLTLDEALPLIAMLLSVPLEGRYSTPTLSPQQQRQQTLDTLVAWLTEESEKQPVLVVWEDLHWADPSTLEMLGLVLQQSPTVPLLNALTFRPEFNPPWPTRSHITPLTLNRLERPQVEALITHLAGGKTLPVDVVEHIVAKTDGVPLYVEELTKMLLASDLLQEKTDQYVLTGPLATVAIPDTLQDSLMARLDQLKTAKEVAQLGAVLGREFTYEALQLIASQDEDTLRTGLAQLVNAELLYQRGRLPRARYIFKHALIQDAAYASLLRSTRQQVHRQIAQVLERSFPEVVETQPELLAHHYTEAGQHEAAIRYWQQAGQHALLGSALAEAIVHLTQGLTLLTALPETPARLQQELDLRVALGPALIDAKGHGIPEVERTYARAQELCKQLGNTPQLFPVLRGLMLYHMTRGPLQTASQLGEQLLRLAQAQSDPALLMLAHGMLGQVLFYRGEPAASQTHLTQALAIYTPQAHRALAVRYGVDLGVASGIWLAWALWQLGYPDQALQHSQTACTLAHEASHPYSLGAALLWSAYVHQHRREARAAQEQAVAVTTLATEQGFASLVAWGTVFHGWALAAQGQHVAGVAEIRQGLAADPVTGGAKQFQPYFLGLLAEAYREGGHPEEGLNALAEALAVMDTTQARYYGAELYRLQGTLLLNTACSVRHAILTPEDCFQKALCIARDQHAKSLELRAATSLARLWQSQGKRQEAYDLLAPVHSWFTEGFDTADLKDAKAILETLH